MPPGNQELIRAWRETKRRYIARAAESAKETATILKGSKRLIDDSRALLARTEMRGYRSAARTE